MDDSKRILVDLTNLNRNFDYCDQGHTLTSLDHLLMVNLHNPTVIHLGEV